MKTVTENELILGADLYIVARLELAITHMIFLHPHECRVFVGLTIAITFPERFLLFFIFLKTRQQVLAE
jgi:hypothetical protein